jgi:hypothetical protein
VLDAIDAHQDRGLRIHGVAEAGIEMAGDGEAVLVRLIDQRRKLQDELRGVQALINEEFERIMHDAQEAPARMLAQFNDSGKSRRNGTPKDTIRLEVAEAV